MAKRYGRNQKRKHREMIANLNEIIESKEKSIRHYSEGYAHIRNQFESFIQEFNKWWKNSVLIEPKVIEINIEFPPEFRMEVFKDSMYGINYAQQRTTCDTIDLAYQSLHALEIACKHNIGDRHMHIMLYYQGQYKYYIDEKALYTFRGPPEVMARYISQEILHVLESKYLG